MCKLRHRRVYLSLGKFEQSERYIRSLGLKMYIFLSLNLPLKKIYLLITSVNAKYENDIYLSDTRIYLTLNKNDAATSVNAKYYL